MICNVRNVLTGKLLELIVEISSSGNALLLPELYVAQARLHIHRLRTEYIVRYFSI